MMASTIAPFLLALLAPAPAEPTVADTAEPSPSAPEADADAPNPDEAMAPAPEGEPAPDVATEPAANPFAPAPAVDPTPAVPAATPMPPPIAPIPPPPPRPIRWRLDFAANVGTTVIQDLGYRAFAERRNLPEYGASAIFDFRLAEGRFFLGGGLAYVRSRRGGDAHGEQILTHVAFHEPRVVGRVSLMAIEGVDAFARVGVGPSIGALSLRSEQQAHQTVVLPRVDAHAGLSLYLPKAWLPRKQAGRVTAGLELGMGYAWRGAIDVRPELQQGDEPLRATTAPLGELSLHGFSWGLGLFVRVM